MAYADPQSVTINAVPISLPRTGSATNAGSFKSNDGIVTLSVSSSYGKRTRRVLKLEHSKIAADPLIPAVNTKSNMMAYLVVDTPGVGYSVTEQKQIVDALTAYLSASTGARVTQLLGGEN